MKLSDPVSSLAGVGPQYLKKLERLGVSTIDDLLHHIPARHVDFSNKTSIRNLTVGEEVTIVGQVVTIDNIYTKTGKIFQIAKVSDGEASVDAVWARQPYLVRTLPPGTVISMSGKLSFFGRKRAFMFPQFEKYTGESLHTGRLVPIYPETEGVSSKWLRRLIDNTLKEVEITDFMNENMLSSLGMVSFSEALNKTHKAEGEEEFEKAIERLSFNELLLMQIENTFKKYWWQYNTNSHSIKIDDKSLAKFTKNLPFELTLSQQAAVENILSDLQKDIPMNRLLEGDVGSGKTVVAASGAYAAFFNSKKTVFMAPTQILAEQHFHTLNQIFSLYNIKISLVTSDQKPDENDESDLYVGTHALLFREELVRNAGYLVIDEQHRFGVSQRAKIAELARSGKTSPHILTMTATPIPRTIALTIYGDLDLSTLTELPKGRKQTKTWLVPPQKRKSAEAWIAEQISKKGIQAFVVCPLIEESDAETLSSVKAATKEFERLKKVFPDFSIALLHGRMSAKEKSRVLKEFKNKEHQILVSTPVIEVGIDVKNANIMVIEAAERFGLAQLHQLRGRVGRGEKEAYCLLFTESKSEKVKARLESVAHTKSGKELAELDLETRGPGEILGIRQHGLPELKIAKWNDFALIQKAREVANEVVGNQDRYKSVLLYYKNKQVAPN